MPKGKPNKRYTGEFKQMVVEAVIKEKMSYTEAARIYEVSDHHRIQSWERIYLEEGPEGLYIERRGRKSTGRPHKLSEKVEEDLLAEVQRLRAENEYQKTCRPWLWKESGTRRKNKGDPETEAEISVGIAADNRSNPTCNLLLSPETNEQGR